MRKLYIGNTRWEVVRSKPQTSTPYHDVRLRRGDMEMAILVPDRVMDGRKASGKTPCGKRIRNVW